MFMDPKAFPWAASIYPVFFQVFPRTTVALLINLFACLLSVSPTQMSPLKECIYCLFCSEAMTVSAHSQIKDLLITSVPIL